MAPSTTQVTHNTLIAISSSPDARLARALPSSLQGPFELRTTSANLSLCLRTVRNFTRSPVFQTFSIFKCLLSSTHSRGRHCTTSLYNELPTTSSTKHSSTVPPEPSKRAASSSPLLPDSGTVTAPPPHQSISKPVALAKHQPATSDAVISPGSGLFGRSPEQLVSCLAHSSRTPFARLAVETRSHSR